MLQWSKETDQQPRATSTDSLIWQETAAEVFDAIVSAVGNYHEPNLPDVDGIEAFPGKKSAMLHLFIGNVASWFMASKGK